MTPRCEFEVSGISMPRLPNVTSGVSVFCPSYDALHEMIGTVLGRLPEGSSILSAGAGTGGRPLSGASPVQHSRVVDKT